MPLVLLALIAVVFLTGVVTLAMGSKGWHWGTIAGAWMVLLAAVGFTYLVGMLAERERAWRAVIATYQSAIAKERDAMVRDKDGFLKADLGNGNDGKTKSVAELKQDQARWERVRDRINTWRGRSWEKATFQPPADDKAGRITIEGIDNPSINPGAELFVFDTIGIEEGGRFLGVFNVDAADKNTFQISAAIAPTENDASLWAKPHEEVTIYENLPIDRWLAFYKATPDGEEKTTPEDMLKDLEKKLREVTTDEEPVADEEVGNLVSALQNKEIAPGLYWATVTFTQPHVFPPAEGNAAEPRQFEPEDTATFDLETAKELETAGVVSITSVVSRRPLTDGDMAMRGSSVFETNGKKLPFHVNGMAFIRRTLTSDIVEAESMTEQFRGALENLRSGQIQPANNDTKAIEDDLRNWQKDAQAALKTSDSFAARVGEVTAERDASEAAVVQLGQALVKAVTTLMAEIDRRTPPPANPPPAG